MGAPHRCPSDLDLTPVRIEEERRGTPARPHKEEFVVAKAKRKQQTGKTVLEKRRLKKAKREVVTRERKRAASVA